MSRVNTMTDVIYNVDVGRDVKAFLITNLANIEFDNPDLKSAIRNADDNDLLRVGRVINSHKVVSVEILTSDFFRNHLFRE